MSKKEAEQLPRNIFVTQAGKKVELAPVSQMDVQRVREGAARKAAELYGTATKPTYRTEMGEEIEHDEATIADERTSDEEKAAWEKWKSIQSRTDAYVNNKVMEFFLYHGVKVNAEDDADWIAEQAFFDIATADNPIQRKIDYIYSRLIYTAEDIREVTIRIMALAGVDEEVVRAHINSFRNPVG